MDPWNSKIVNADVNWTNLRHLYHQMQIKQVGVQAFSKLFGRIVLSLPYFFKERSLLAPMPAAFMFNYMMSVTSSPCENLTDLSSISQVPLVNSLIHKDGGGAELVGYQLRSKDKSLVLHHFGVGSDHATKDKIIRVVEVRQHPLGRDMEILVLLEIVDRKLENGSFRCVCLDANRIINAVCSLPINEDYIEVLDVQVKF